MRFRSILFLRIIVGFLILVSFLSLDTHSGTSHPRRRVNESQTNLDIGNAQCNFLIRLNGDYQCAFTLEIVGNYQTANGLGRGEFAVPSLQVSNLTICYFTTTVVLPSSVEGNTSVFRFTLNQSIPERSTSTIEGEFSGTLEENKSGVYSYDLGIDWGTTVGQQKTEIKLNGQQYTLISIGPKEPLTSVSGTFLVLTWNEVFSQGFYCHIEIEPHDVSPSGLLIIYPHSGVELKSWNATIGQDLEVLIRNIGTYEIEGYIYLNSSWINVNVSKFVLTPSQEISVLCSISDNISPGSNGTIEIISWKWIDSNIPSLPETIIIPVYVLAGTNLNESHPLLNQLLPVGLLFSVVIFCIIVYYRREDIKLTIQKKINSFTDNSTSNSQVMTTHWESVQSKWSPILPEREMDLLELLFIHGSMNQQALADKLGVSKGTVSRIISRLEAKKLLFRERLGMSNLIKINKDHL